MYQSLHYAKFTLAAFFLCSISLTSCSDKDSEPEISTETNTKKPSENHYAQIPLNTRQNIKKVFPGKRLASTEIDEYKTELIYDGIFLTDYIGSKSDGAFKFVWEKDCIKIFNRQNYNASPETAKPYRIGVLGESGNIEEIKNGDGTHISYLTYDTQNHLVEIQTIGNGEIDHKNYIALQHVGNTWETGNISHKTTWSESLTEDVSIPDFTETYTPIYNDMPNLAGLIGSRGIWIVFSHVDYSSLARTYTTFMDALYYTGLLGNSTKSLIKEIYHTIHWENKPVLYDTFSYEYDSDGYPIKITNTYGGGHISSLTFIETGK